MILLDTHILLWFWLGGTKLGNNSRKVIEKAWTAGEASVSAISFWEISMLENKKKISLSEPVENIRRELLADGLNEVKIDGEISIRAAALANFPKDPADRIIAATAQTGYTLLTTDKHILKWKGNLKRLAAEK